MEFESTLTIEIVIYSVLITTTLVTTLCCLILNFTNAKTIKDVINKIL